jgi:hypothetical protein
MFAKNRRPDRLYVCRERLRPSGRKPIFMDALSRNSRIRGEIATPRFARLNVLRRLPVGDRIAFKEAQDKTERSNAAALKAKAAEAHVANPRRNSSLDVSCGSIRERKAHYGQDPGCGEPAQMRSPAVSVPSSIHTGVLQRLLFERRRCRERRAPVRLRSRQLLIELSAWSIRDV